jgi:tetratricopeptide (TPR) repeat protein
MTETVRAWQETITLPTYAPPAPDLNPMFLEKRVNQGTSGRVYPYPFLDKLSDERAPRDYEAVYLENEYLRLMMLPELGGRIYEALDKTNGYNFIYRQHVIKPALIGLLGAWISGGVEFNWPQHHRPSTFMPTHHLIEKRSDGSATVWLSENDPLQRMKGMVGICLYPGKSFFEMKVQLYNRTPDVQTFLWWINVGIHVHEEYQVVFPPDVTVVTDHSKRSMSHYPVSHETYYGIDYSNNGAGTDLSWFGAIPIPTSYFVWDTNYDYFGGYDHCADAGIIHTANRYIAPGKKMFTWGAGEFARGWESNLTDEDGLYIELMAGVYTDNQPDFSWLQPYETKTFSQFLYPVQQIGLAKNANRIAALNLEGAGATITVGVAVTERLANASVALTAGDEVLLERTLDLAPDAPLVAEVTRPADVADTDLLLRLLDAEGHEVLRYAPQAVETPELPEAKTPPPPPEAFDTVEELYLTGLHLEQYRHPTIEPEPYWEAALVRDPSDVRCNNALGLTRLRRGQFAEAAAHFQTAIDKLTRRNPNPRDGEPYYNLGATRKFQGDLDGAYTAFYKAIWSYAWQAASYYALAEIDCHRGDLHKALDHLDHSLQTNAMNTKARNLRTAVLRHLGQLEEAAAMVAQTLELDPLDIVSRNEAVWISRARNQAMAAESQLAELTNLLEVPDTLSRIQSYLDIAFDYASAALWEEATDLLERLIDPNVGNLLPTVLHALAYFAHRMGRDGVAVDYLDRAAGLPTDYCFPSRLEEMLALEYAKSVRPNDATIPYYLGNLYYDKQRHADAIANWERAVELAPEFAIPYRNLGIAAYNVRHDPEEAIDHYERAFELAPEDGRVLSELDQLRQRTGVAPADRLALLEAHLDLVRDRDDLSVEITGLYNQTGQPQKALDYALARRFHAWEGGTGRISRHYVQAHLMLARAAIDAEDAATALSHCERAQASYPDNLGERKDLRWPDADIHYTTGMARRALGDEAGAQTAFEAAVRVRDDAVSETTYYRGLALCEMGRADEARSVLTALLNSAQSQLEEQARQGFATSVPEFVFAEGDMGRHRKTDLTYLTGLACMGLGLEAEARDHFESVLALEPHHPATRWRLQELAN